jgi:general secretion pathway protein G
VASVRKGFTLVEILITLVVIGILAGSMLLVFGPARERARASRIVSEMRSLKVAAVMYYHEHRQFPPEGGLSDSFAENYFGRPVPASGDNSVWYSFTSESDDYLVEASLPDNTELRKHLAGLAETSGLYEDRAATSPYAADKGKAYMPVASR